MTSDRGAGGRMRHVRLIRSTGTVTGTGSFKEKGRRTLYGPGTRPIRRDLEIRPGGPEWSLSTHTSGIPPTRSRPTFDPPYCYSDGCTQERKSARESLLSNSHTTHGPDPALSTVCSRLSDGSRSISKRFYISDPFSRLPTFYNCITVNLLPFETKRHRHAGVYLYVSLFHPGS